MKVEIELDDLALLQKKIMEDGVYVKALEGILEKAMLFIMKEGVIDGAHHKQWQLDQLARILMEENYDKFVETMFDAGGHWDEGIAP